MKHKKLAILSLTCLPISLGWTQSNVPQDVVHPQISAIQNLSQSLAIPIANHYQQGIALSDYWISEKFDGIRAFWDGERLLTRNGYKINAPLWFTKDLPKQALDGELWAGRGRFDWVQKTVLNAEPDDENWQQITFMVFDAPIDDRIYKDRYAWLEQWFDSYQLHHDKQGDLSHIQLIKQQSIPSHQALMQALAQIEGLNGEGIMLKNYQSYYQGGRSNDLLKLKSYQDDEATVIGYKEGSGKFAGKVGSLKVRWQDKIFHIGSGLSEQDREAPPPVGSLVNFRFNGYTSKGLPKFARYIRTLNKDEPL